MAAKRLARTSGLDYAIMSGGDVAPLGGKAVTQLHEVRGRGDDGGGTSKRGGGEGWWRGVPGCTQQLTLCPCWECKLQK